MGNSNQIELKSIEGCLGMNLNIPIYQRPYKWSIQSVDELLGDIDNAINKSKGYSDFKYRIGTIILHKEGGIYNVVDGQQRLITLTLINKHIDEKFKNKILDFKFGDQLSRFNIKQNYQHIREWFMLHDSADAFKRAMSDILEVVVITVNHESEAFQLFDSQNTRGRALDPHDLLKAYHLREMKNDPYEMEFAVNKWEAKEASAIRSLFATYLFPIWNWSRGRKSPDFTDKEIDRFKGISSTSTYTYARRASKAMPFFQLTEPFIAGGDFFEMVDHYMRLLDVIKREMATERFRDINDFCVTKREHSQGLKHVQWLFWATLLFYYDRFHVLDELSVKKIFIWAFMLRVDLDRLGSDSVNKYAIGEFSGGNYSNCIPMFSRIATARLHTEIGRIPVRVAEKGGFSKERLDLYNFWQLYTFRPKI